jgi:uncharacterized protein (TIGR02598 family)
VKLARATSAARAAAAFTLVEIVVAMAILLIGMSAILGLLTFGAALARNAQLRTAASSSIDAVVADLEESFFPLVQDEATGEWVAGEPAPIEGRPVPGHPGLTYSARPKPEPAPANARDGAQRYLVQVEVRWQTSGQARTKAFEVLLLREVPFGARLRRQFLRAAEAPQPSPPATNERSAGARRP